MLVSFSLEVEGHGRLRFLRALPKKEDSWGVLAPLRGTGWQEAICICPGDVLSHALHGYPWPLMRILGPPPEVLCRKMPFSLTGCREALLKNCYQASQRKCRPGTQKPFCYVPLEDSSGVLLEVVQGLSDGCYLIVTEGRTFSCR